MTEYKLLISNRNFVHLWISQILSQFSINFLNFVIITVLYKSTGSAIVVSLVWIFYAIPVLMLGPFASSFVDLLDKKKILIYTNLLQSMLVLFYVFATDISVFLLFGLVFMYSLLNQFYLPAELASVPYIVDKKRLSYANSLFLITQQSAVVFGFGFASLFLSLLGFRASLLVSSSFLFIAFISVNLISGIDISEKKRTFERSLSKIFLHIIDGYKYIKENRKILAPLLLIIGLQVILAIGFTNLPIFAEQIFKVPIEYAGILIVVPAGAGAAISAFTIPRSLLVRRKLNVIRHALQLATFSIFLLIFAVEWMVAAAYLSVFLLGFSFIAVLIPSQTFLQEHTPIDFRGRVFGNLWLLTTMATIIPLMISASLVEVFGVKILLFIIAMSALMVYLFLHRYGEKMMYNSNRTGVY